MERPSEHRSAPGATPLRLGQLAARVAKGLGVASEAEAGTASAGADDGHRRALDAARHYRHLYYSAPVALVSADAAGTVLRWNDRADAWFGDRLRRGRVNTLPMLLGEQGAAALLQAAVSSGAHRAELRTRCADDGLERVFTVDARAVGDAVELSLFDVSDRSRVTAALEHMAHHDVLTDQLNRRGLERALEACLSDASKAGSALIYVDLDRFKAINDVFGHAVGDAVVVEVAGRLRAALPEDGVLARIGGDEFVALLPGVDLDRAQPVAIELLHALTVTPCLADGLSLPVEASLGLVEVGPPLATREALALADEACARAKRAGRGRVTAVRADERMLDALRDSVRLGSMLKTRLPVERLKLYAQPIVPLAGQERPCGYEVLLRTVGEDGQIGSPGPLLEAAERHGGMSVIDRFVLEGTLAHLAAHPEHAAGAAFYAVNLGGPSLNDERFVRDAVAMLAAHPTLAPRLCLEITEAVAVHDLRGARRFIDAFLDTGVAIALDDFGAGFTSFAYLKHLPASLLKIDGQFVVGLEHDRRQRGIVRAIVALAHELGMRCVAEWVEDAATLQALRALQVDYAQGFLFERPHPIAHWVDRPVRGVTALPAESPLAECGSGPQGRLPA